jgi:two-component system response regulator
MSTGEILLVEDNPNDAELTLRALGRQNLGGKALLVKDGVEALDYLFATGPHSRRNYMPKVILLDLKLPKINGFEVLQTIKSDERTRLIPVVMLTSSAEEQDINECYRLGVNSYIVKSLDYSKFVESLAELGNYWLMTNTPPVGIGRHAA